MKTVIDDFNLETISTSELMNLIGNRQTKLGTGIENDVTSEFWKRYPFHIVMSMARKVEDMEREIQEIKDVIAGLTQFLIDKGILPQQ